MFVRAQENVVFCACALESPRVHSLKGDASFDFLLITQHALCSVVNCPGPVFLSLGDRVELE